MRNGTHIYFPLATDILKGMKSLTCFSDALIKGFFFQIIVYKKLITKLSDIKFRINVKNEKHFSYIKKLLF